MEGGIFSSYIPPGRNFCLCPTGLALDQMSSQNCVPNSIRGSISFVSGHDRLEPWSNLFACTDRFEFKQKKSENGVILHTIGSTENAMQEDEHCASDSKIHGKSCVESATLENKSREISLKQNSCLHKQKVVGNSITLFPEYTHKAFGKESFLNSQFGCSRIVQLEKYGNLLETKSSCRKDDKMPIFGHGSRYHEKNENFSEIEVNLNIYDESPIAVSQTRYLEENGNFFPETDIPCNRHDKSHIAGHQTGNSKNVLQPGNKVMNGSFNKMLMVEQNETCLEMPNHYRMPHRKTTAASQLGFSSSFSNSEENDRNNETAVEANCKSRSAAEDCTSFKSFKNQGNAPLGKLTYKLEQITDTNKSGMTVLTAYISSGAGAATVAGEEDLEKEWCISVLQKYGLLDLSYEKSAPIEHPGVVGDGSCEKTCKLCGFLEDSTGTLICDMCEESFHVSCCLEVNSISFEDDWYCPTCRKKRKRPVSKPFLESRDNQDRQKFQTAVQDKASEDKSDLFWHMLQDNETYMSKVRIGKEYQADVPDWTGTVPASPGGNPFMVKALPFEEMVHLEELARQKMKNDIWGLHWKSAKYLPTYPKESMPQPRNVVYIKGEAHPHGRRAKRDVLSGKWRSRLQGCSQVPYDRPYRPVTLYDRPPRISKQPTMPSQQPTVLHVLRGGPPGQFA